MHTNSDDRHIHIRLRLVSSSLHHTTTVLYTEKTPYSPSTHTPFQFPWPSSSLNRKLTLFTQCLSSVGVGYPSPLNTCPKCPPQLLHTISVRSIPNDRSVCLVTAPGMESKYAGHPHPDLNLCVALYNGASHPAQL